MLLWTKSENLTYMKSKRYFTLKYFIDILSIPSMKFPFAGTHPYINTRIYVPGNWVIIGSGNGLAPGRRQAITSSNADILSVGLLGTDSNGIEIKTPHFSPQKINFKMSSAQHPPFDSDLISSYAECAFWGTY